MITFTYPEGADQFDAAAFKQSGEFIKSGHREECEQAAIEAHGLYCIWVNGRPVIKGDFEAEIETLMFSFDDQEFTLDDMLTTNSHDPDFCEWVKTAQLGDSFMDCRRIA